MGIRPNTKANIYFINNHITDDIINMSRLKKYQGIIYINRNITEVLYRNLKKKFGGVPTIDKFVLIDNGNAAKHRDLYGVFEEVFFYERFKKNRIVEYTSTVRGPDTHILDRNENIDELI